MPKKALLLFAAREAQAIGNPKPTLQTLMGNPCRGAHTSATAPTRASTMWDHITTGTLSCARTRLPCSEGVITTMGGGWGKGDARTLAPCEARLQTPMLSSSNAMRTGQGTSDVQHVRPPRPPTKIQYGMANADARA